MTSYKHAQLFSNLSIIMLIKPESSAVNLTSDSLCLMCGDDKTFEVYVNTCKAFVFCTPLNFVSERDFCQKIQTNSKMPFWLIGRELVKCILKFFSHLIKVY